MSTVQNNIVSEGVLMLTAQYQGLLGNDQHFLIADPELDGRFAMPGYEEFLEDAREKRQQYNLKLEGLLRMYGIHSEAELMTGFIEKYHEKLGREKTDIAAMAASVRQNLMKMFREEFFKVNTWVKWQYF